MATSDGIPTVPRNRKLSEKIPFRTHSKKVKNARNSVPRNINIKKLSKICVRSSALQQAVLSLDMGVSFLLLSVPPLDVYALLHSVLPLNECVLQQTVLHAPWTCLFYGSLWCHWAFLFYNILCSHGRVCSTVQQSVLPCMCILCMLYLRCS